MPIVWQHQRLPLLGLPPVAGPLPFFPPIDWPNPVRPRRGRPLEDESSPNLVLRGISGYSTLGHNYDLDRPQLRTPAPQIVEYPNLVLAGIPIYPYLGLDSNDLPNAIRRTLAPQITEYPNLALGFGPSTGASFDFYVSPTGLDTNTGSLVAPWAITSLVTSSPNFSKTSGKRIGFLPGTYNVSTMMQGSSGGENYMGAFQIDGGSPGSPTYYGSSDSSGRYSRGTATITAQTSGGLSGGGQVYPANGPMLMGCSNDNIPPLAHPTGWLTIDGLNFTGYSYKAVRIGAVSSTDGPPITGDVIIQNCTFFGQFFQSGAGVDNAASIWMDGTATVGAGGTGNYQITNNYFHDNNVVGMGSSSTVPQHLCSIFLFNCANVQITYNTCINAGSFAWGKDKVNQGTICAYNYTDNTGTTWPNGVQNSGYGFSDFTGTFSGGTNQITTGLSLTSKFYNNIVVTNSWGFGLRGAAENEAWITPVQVYNNTIIQIGGAGATPDPLIWLNMYPTFNGEAEFYNNILTGPAASDYKTFVTSGPACSILDYNGEPATTMSWGIGPAGQGNTISSSYTSPGAFATGLAAAGGISGAESHSVANNTPGFTGTNTGYISTTYQLASSSPFKNKGSTTGTGAGAACDIGAWGGVSPPTQIGCTFGP